ncbi:hypothetical protein FXO38_04551 [Capsicum annuum]|uniref:Uncharacterized protein n=1 Tax=Capsicum annuum TaxID=4072 RepID=A0A2G2Z617_CAPAN|nr:hypothetical protein FXO38_04551 [Capsicum annuum]PHT77341.1 hypothetical protein T459_20863 [Capsicum annuum]
MLNWVKQLATWMEILMATRRVYPLRVASCIWELGTDVWMGIRPPIDVDSFGRSDSEVAESKIGMDSIHSSGRKRRSDRDGVVLDVDSFTRRLRKPRVDTQKEINQHTVKEALLARGESQFTDQEFPPNDRSLFTDPDNPPSKLQVSPLASLCSYFYWSSGFLGWIIMCGTLARGASIYKVWGAALLD